ncbi:hypothetical protein RHS03_08102, partial [Rhizoctonia solani]
MRQAMNIAGISSEDANEFTTAGMEDFKENIKFAFSDKKKEYLVQISSGRYNNSALKTRRGRMALPGYVK